MIDYSFRIEGEFSPGVWTSFGRDLQRPITFGRGNASRGPKDVVATTGSLSFNLNNSEYSTGGVGYYSPNHPNRRAGFLHGMWVRAVFTVDGVDYVRWTGKIRVIDPAVGLNGSLTTRVLAQDVMTDIAEADILQVQPQLNKNEVELYDVVLDSLIAESQPRGRALDSPVSTFKVALDDLASGQKGLSVLERITTSVRGRLYLDGDSNITYVNRNTLQLRVPSYTFAANEAVLSVPSDLKDVYNRFRLTLHPKDFSPSTIDLAVLTGALELEPGAQQTFFLQYKHPTYPDIPIGGTGFVTPVSGTDWVFNAAADGSGANLTGSVTMSVGFFSTSAVVTVTNNAAVTAYKTTLKVRGTGIYDLNPYDVESYTPRAYGNRPQHIDLPYSDNALDASADAAFLNATFRDLTSQIAAISFYPQRSEDLMEQAMTRELIDVVTGSDPVALPGGTASVIQYMEWTINQDNVLHCRFVMSPWIVAPIELTETVLLTDALIATSAARESRIDFATIGYSEIG